MVKSFNLFKKKKTIVKVSVQRVGVEQATHRNHRVCVFVCASVCMLCVEVCGVCMLRACVCTCVLRACACKCVRTLCVRVCATCVRMLCVRVFVGMRTCVCACV